MSDNQPTEQNPFTSRRFILAAVVVGVVLLCAVILVVGTVVGGQAKPTAGPSPSSTATHSTAADADPSTCGLPGYQPTGTLTSAPNAKWELVGTVAAPTDPKGAGPGLSESSGFRSCFAHTPTGALYAAANVVAMGSVPGLVKEVTDKLVVPGPGRDAALAQTSGTSQSSSIRYQIAGFKMLAYDGRTARVDIAVNASSGQLVSFVQSLQWDGGDWKVVLDDQGNPPVPPAALQSLGGYIPWSGA